MFRFSIVSAETPSLSLLFSRRLASQSTTIVQTRSKSEEHKTAHPLVLILHFQRNASTSNPPDTVVIIYCFIQAIEGVKQS
ncbi:hypothetical protein WAI453_004672 [Rhynchosporium graminicola]